MMILKTIEITITIHTHTYTSILGDMQGAGVHSAGVDLDAAAQGRGLRDADRMEIQKCDGLTYRLTRVGARDVCALHCGPVGPNFKDWALIGTFFTFWSSY